MCEVELKSVVDDLPRRRKAVEDAGGKPVFEGRLIDKRLGDAGGMLLQQDHVLRIRVYASNGNQKGSLDWKGPTVVENGFKVREEISTDVDDPEAVEKILESLGFTVILEIERQIWQYELQGAVVRFEEYPRMDVLVEVEGSPDAIELAIRSIGLDRTAFSSDRLSAFVQRFEARTGQRRALSSRELAGDYPYSPAAG